VYLLAHTTERHSDAWLQSFGTPAAVACELPLTPGTGVADCLIVTGRGEPGARHCRHRATSEGFARTAWGNGCHAWHCLIFQPAPYGHVQRNFGTVQACLVITFGPSARTMPYTMGAGLRLYVRGPDRWPGGICRVCHGPGQAWVPPQVKASAMSGQADTWLDAIRECLKAVPPENP